LACPAMDWINCVNEKAASGLDPKAALMEF
jgi:hypothetical protein